MSETKDVVDVTTMINGKMMLLTGEATRPAIGVLRELGLFSVRETCGLGVCGTCTVQLDGEPVSTCILPFYALDGKAVVTTEGLGEGGELSELQQQFIDSQAFQCSFCTPGFLMSGTALLDSTEGELTREQVNEGLHGHLCRCGCYVTITEAVRTCAARRCGKTFAAEPPVVTYTVQDGGGTAVGGDS